MEQQPSFVSRVGRNRASQSLRRQWRADERIEMRAGSTTLGVVLIGTIAALVTLGNSL